MENYCAFSQNHECIMWTDYEITRQEIEEANTLCHGNWIELQSKQRYIATLQEILINNGIEFPEE